MASTCSLEMNAQITRSLVKNKSEQVTLNNHEHFQTDWTKYAYIIAKKVKIT